MSYIQHATPDYHFEDPLPDLARANWFTMADLEQNRRGPLATSNICVYCSAPYSPSATPVERFWAGFFSAMR